MIIDASVVVKWFAKGEDDAEVAFALIGDHQLRAPSLLLTEVGNALWKRLRRGEYSETLDLLARHAELPQVVEIIDENANELVVRAMELALQLDHPIYDCVYLALAEREDDVLVTADDAFRRKVEATEYARHVRALGV